jgi:alanyl-tRNA synthetase
VSQAGSLVDFERLRFDFNSSTTPSEAQLLRVESMINGWIADSVRVGTSTMALAAARSAGATAMFGEKYGDEVRVVDVAGVSKELCGGTHVGNTSELGGFKARSDQERCSALSDPPCRSSPRAASLLACAG